MIEKTQGVVLRVGPYGETSQWLAVYTRTRGKVRLLAKGIRRGGKRKPSVSLQPSDRIDLAFYVRTRADLHPLSEWSLRGSSEGLRRNLGRLYAAEFLLELVDRQTSSEDVAPEVFDLLDGAIASFSGGNDPARTVVQTEATLLRLLGHRPVLDRCTRCGGARTGSEPVVDPREGGVLCPECVGHEGGMRVPRSVLVAAEGLLRLSEGGQERMLLSPEVVAGIHRMLVRFWIHHLEAPSRVAPYLDRELFTTFRSEGAGKG